MIKIDFKYTVPFGLLILNGVQSIIATTRGQSGKNPAKPLHCGIVGHFIYFTTKET